MQLNNVGFYKGGLIEKLLGNYAYTETVLKTENAWAQTNVIV